MNVALQNQIAPPSSPGQRAKAAKDNPVVDGNGGDKIDFKTLLGNSNYEVQQERKSKVKGDLSGFESDQELFQALNESTEGKNQRVPKNNLDKDDFMKLFIAQLQNQDPLKPKEDYEMAAHLAQFNGLEQMLNVNKKLEELANLQKMNQSVSMIDYIGKEINIDGGKVKVEGGKPQGMNYTISTAVPNAKAEVRNGAGKVVAELDLGARSEGRYTIDEVIMKKDGGQLTDGTYTFSISSESPDGKKTEIPITTTVTVNGVSLKEGDGKLFTNIGELASNEVASVGKKGFMLDSIDKTPKQEVKDGQGKSDVSKTDPKEGGVNSVDAKLDSTTPQQSVPDQNKAASEVADSKKEAN